MSNKGDLMFLEQDELVVFSGYMDFADDYMHLYDEVDEQEVKNYMWKAWHENVEEEPLFDLLDSSWVNMWLTPASGPSKRGGGFVYCGGLTGPGGPEFHIVASCRWLVRVDDQYEFVKQMVRHEMCHLIMYSEFGNHDEDDERFQELLETTGSPKTCNWRTKEFVY